MGQSMKKKTVLATALPISMIAGLALATSQTVTAGYLTDSAGGVVKNGYGECWQAAGGTTKMMPECGDVMPAKEDPDSDGDGVPDSRDKCPNTPKGAPVDSDGCPLDSDGDGVPDYKDKCPGTRAGAKVDADGCEIMADVTINTTTDHFDFDSAVLKPAMKSELDSVASKVMASPGSETLSIVGHTDSTGPEAYNQGLSERRAQSAADYLAEKGIARNSMTVSGMGESSPVADNSTRAGRAKNRRVEIKTK